MWISLQVLRYSKLIENNIDQMEILLVKNKQYKRKLKNYEDMICEGPDGIDIEEKSKEIKNENNQ